MPKDKSPEEKEPDWSEKLGRNTKQKIMMVVFIILIPFIAVPLIAYAYIEEVVTDFLLDNF
jgi:hypothetical protein